MGISADGTFRKNKAASAGLPVTAKGKNTGVRAFHDGDRFPNAIAGVLTITREKRKRAKVTNSSLWHRSTKVLRAELDENYQSHLQMAPSAGSQRDPRRKRQREAGPAPRDGKWGKWAVKDGTREMVGAPLGSFELLLRKICDVVRMFAKSPDLTIWPFLIWSL